MNLTVAVLTYKRPDDIAALLPLLRDQIASVASAQLGARILVVDNDAEGSAAAYVTQFAAESPGHTIDYVIEAVPGISLREIVLSPSRPPVRSWRLSTTTRDRRSDG